jgi:hypothetical protein
MTPRSQYWLRFLGAIMVLALAGNVQANIWLDENFEDEEVFVQRDGTVAGENGWDTHTTNALLSVVTETTGYTESGAVSSSKAFRGERSYRLGVGEALVVGPEYQDSQNGNFQMFQFAVNVDPIPSEGVVATFRWDHDMDTTNDEPDHSVFVRLESDGSQVTITAGEDLAHDPETSGVIGTLNSTSDWAFITVLVQKSDSSTADSRFPFLGEVDQGIYFFNSSLTSSFSAGFIGGDPSTYAGRGWSFTVDSGAVYLDEMYWDGGMDDNLLEDSRFRPFDLQADVPPVTVQDWIYVD